MKNVNPQDQVFWYLKRKNVNPCRKNIKTEIAIIGGGMAGLSAAQEAVKLGKKVTLFEQYYCGAGASGKSSGYITPNAELSLTDFINKYGKDNAHKIWNLFTNGVENIRKNILENNLNCDYSKQDTLVLANSKKDLKSLSIENKNLQELGFKTALYNQNEIQNYVNSKKYFGGVLYENTFGIDSYLYCQEIKNLLQNSGVEIFEETPVLEIQENKIKTLYAEIEADYIIICTDRFMPQLGFLKQEIYHAQTFLTISQVLSEEQVKLIFPKEKYMTWDTDLIYSYFRITGSNRLLVGGANILNTYSSKELHNYQPMINKLTNYINQKFPELKVQFEQIWPGLIGLSKDIAPIAGRDKYCPKVYYVTACSGLHIANALGRYAVQNLIENRTDCDEYFSPYRKFLIGGIAQKLLGTKVSFALSNGFIKL